MLSFRLAGSPKTASVLLVTLLALAGCNNGGGGGLNVSAPTGLSYPIPAPYIVGQTISPLLPTLTAGTANTYAVAPALPSGLVLDPATGEIRGTPTAVAPSTAYTITASSLLGSVDFAVTIQVDPQAPTGLTFTDIGATYIVGQPIAPNVPSVGGGAVDSWSVAPSLPTGLALDAVTGEISGTPSAASPLAVYTVTAANITGSDSFDVTITVNPEAPCGLAFTDPAPVYTVNSAIAPNAGSSACGPVANWSVTPALPAGLLLDSATGTLSGTPTAELAATVFTFTGSNVTGSATVDVTITILPEAPLTLTYGQPSATYLAGLAITPNVPSVTGGLPTSWTVSPALPAGLLLDPATGVISGTPTALAAASNFLVTASNISGSVDATLTLAVDPQAPCDLEYATINSVVQLGLPMAPNAPSWNCGDPDTYSIAPALPAGLALDPVTGVISGTPTALSALTSYTVTASNVTGSDTRAITITVNPQAPCNLSYGNQSATYLDGITISPNTPSFACGPVNLFTISPALPNGLALDPSTGIISGTPIGSSPTTTYTVVASNVSGSDSVSFQITVIPQAPSALTYGDSNPVYQLDLPITANLPSFSGGQPDNYTITPALPAGLQLNASTGAITGTPTVLTAPTVHTITASNLTGSTQVAMTLEVVPQPPCNLSYTNQNAIYLDQTPITPNVASSSCGAVDTWSIAPALPAGLSLDPATGTISGTPTELSPTTVYTVTATNVTGSATIAITLTVNPLAPCNLSYGDLTPTYLAGLPITANLPTWACGDPSSYSVTPALPGGLSLDLVNGAITGTPAAPTGTGTYTVTASNVTGSDTVVLTITVNPQAPCNLEYTDPAPIYVLGIAIAPNPALYGCGAPDSFSISPPLPAGMNFDPSTGRIRGVPAALQPATVHTVTATNVTGSDTTTITITVNPQAPCNLAYSNPAPTYTVGTAIAANLPSFACGAPNAYAVSPALPAGLALNPTTGAITGTPAAEAATATYTVTASNATGSDTVDLTITVNPEAPCDLAYADANSIYLVGLPITANLPSWNCGDPDTFSVTPALPNGLLLDPVTGVISGTPLVESLFTIYTVTASNISGSDTATISITVNPQAPCNLSYTNENALYTVGLPIALNVPNVECGAPSNYSIAPALPSGLTLNALTGVISGTPGAELPPTTFTVTATNITGSDTATLVVEVQPQTPCNLQYTDESPTYLVGTPIAANVATWNCGTPTSFSVVPALPAGLFLNTSNGVITGTPIEPAPTATYVVTAANASGGTDVTLTLTVNPLAPCTISYSNPAATYLDGDTIVANVPSWTCGDPDTWTIAPALPAGLALDPSTGVISGAPIGLSPLTTYLVTGSNVTGADSVQITIQVMPQSPCNLTYSENPATYQLDLPIAANLPSNDCGTPTAYAVAPALPAGLALDPATGAITGTPTALAPSATYVVTASNMTGQATADLVLEVVPQPPCNVAFPLADAVYLLGDVITANVPTFQCGTPDTWTINPALPAGLALDPATGTISGTPTALSPQTSYTVTATNVTGSDSVFISITVNPQAPAGLTYADPAPVYLQGTQITVNAPSSTGGAIDSYAITPALPLGLTFDTVTGAIAGTPDFVQPATAYTITGSNVTGQTDTTVTITVNPQAPTDLAYGDAAPVYLLGDAITPNLPTSNGGPVDSYSIAPALPAGLALDTLTGAISGTPTALSPATLYTVTATNATGSDTATVTITVNPQGTDTLTYDDPAPVYLIGDAITPNAPTFSGGTPDSFAVTPALPAGLALDPVTGVISGTPTALQGATVHTITATNVTGSATAAVTITVNPQAPTGLTYDDLAPVYLVGDAIAPNTATVTGDVDSYSVAPALPAGLALDPITGTISGTPTAITAAATHTVTATNVTGSTTVDLLITVNPQAPAGLTYGELAPVYLLDLAIAPNAPSSTGGPVESYAIAPALPAGLTIDPLTGVISGTPSALQAATTHTVTATNVTGSITADLLITVNPQAPAGLAYGDPAPVYLLDVAITPNAPTSTGGAIDSYAIAPALPAGLSLDTLTGVISGTPTALSPATLYTVTATNITGSATADVTITVDPQAPAGLTYGDLAPTYVVDTAIAPNLPTVGGGAVDSFAVAPALPAGLALDTLTGAITGTPTVEAATATYTVTATNVTGSSSVDLAITVNPAAPAGLVYGETAPVYLVGDAITPNLPTSTGGPIDLYTIAPALPAGLLLDGATGAISGTPTEVLAATLFTITGSNVTGSTDAEVTITVNPQAPATVTYGDAAPIYLIGDAIAPNAPTVTGGPADSFAVDPALPAGLALDTLTGVISGTPTALVTASVHTVTAENVTGSATTTLSITVNPQAPSALSYGDMAPIYVVDTAIAPNLATVTGDVDLYEVAPALPAGLSLDPLTGAITGTPTVEAAAAAYVVTASNVTGSASATLMITVNPAAPAGLSYGDPAPVYLFGDAITPNSPTSTGGPIASYTIAPALPAGLTIDPATGVIAGTPTALQSATLHTVTATNVTGSTTTDLTITVNPQGVGTLTYAEPAPTYLLGIEITPNVPNFSGGTPDNYSVSPALPTGLSLDPLTGVISGTPTALQAATIHTVTATNVTGSTNGSVTITVNPQAPAGLTYGDLAPTYVVGTMIAANLPTIGGGAVDSYAVAPALPAGLALDTLTGAITGTPTAEAATATYTVTATNVTGSSSVDLAITVNPAAPAGLSYGDPAPTYLLGQAIAPNAPSSTGGPIASYSIAPALPAGLVMSTTTGVISGTPIALQPATTHTVTATNVTGSITADVVITVNPQAPAGLAYANPSPTYLLGDAIAPNAPSSTGGQVASYAVAPALPAGLTLDTLTGVISGTPTALQVATAHTITASNVTGSATATVTITVNPQAPTGLSYASPTPTYVVGTEITPNLPMVGGGAVDSYSVAPALPAGLSLDPATGVITGTPTAEAPLASYVVTATNVTGQATVGLAITVNPAAPEGLTYGDLAPVYLQGDAIAPNAPSSTGGPIASYAVAPALPTGLALDPITGMITGTPTAISAAATYTVTATNVTGSDSVDLTITVNPQAPAGLAYGDPAPTYLLDVAIAPNAPTSTGGPIDSYAIAPALPAGLSFDTLTGVISGTPTALSPATLYTVTATNVTGSATADVTITVNPQAPAGLTYGDLAPTYVVDTAIAPNLPTVGGGAVDSYAVAPALPAGLALDTLTGAITGTPTAEAATATYTVTATNVTGSSSVDLAITVNPAAPAGLTYGVLTAVYLQGDAITPNAPTSTGGPIADYSVSPALPAGLSIDPITGMITGTPTAITAAATYTVTGSNVTGSTTVDLSITVNPQAPAGLAYGDAAPTYLLDVAIAPNAPSSTGGPIDGYTIAPALPAGLSLDPATGVISGTPTALHAATVHTVTATNVTGSATADVMITVNPQAPAGLAYGDAAPIYLLGDAIAPNAPTSTGGAIDSYSIAPALPAGLALDTLTGVISGTPTALQAATVHTVTATNVTGSATADVTITVNPQAPAGLSYGDAAPTYLIGDAIAPNAPTSTGGAVDSYSIAPALPAGLALDTLTGVISGTPTALQTATAHTITATNVTGSTTATVTITVNPQAPTGLTYDDLAPTYVVATAIATNNATVTGVVDGFTVAPALPAGLALDPITGAISGTPTAETATATYTVTASNVTGSTTVDLSITVNPEAPASITYPTPSATYVMLQEITPNVPTFTGGAPDTWTVAPPLPAGLLFDGVTGTISGTPTEVAIPGLYVVNASNVTGSTSTIITIGVENPAPCDLAYPSASLALQTNVAMTPQLPTVGCGGADSYSIAPALPAGLALDTLTGEISGTPTLESAPATYTVTATNAFGTDTFDLTIAVALTAPATVDYGAIDFEFVVNTAITPLLPTTTGGPVASFSVAPALPAGLALDTLTGEISGTPTAIDLGADYTITAANAAGSATVDLSIEIVTNAPCDLDYSEPLAVYPVGQPITPNVAIVGCGGATSFSITPPLAAGLVFDTLTGEISGTPSLRTGRQTHTVTATNAFGTDVVDIEIQTSPRFTFTAPDTTVNLDALGAASFSLPLSVDEDVVGTNTVTDITGLSVALAYDPTLMQITSVSQGQGLADINGVDYFLPQFNNVDGQLTIGAIVSFSFTKVLTAETPKVFADVDFDMVSTNAPPTMTTSAMTWANLVGSPPVDNLVVLDGSAGGGIQPLFVAPTITIVPAP